MESDNKRKVWLWIVIGLAVVLVCCLVTALAGFFGFFSIGNNAQILITAVSTLQVTQLPPPNATLPVQKPPTQAPPAGATPTPIPPTSIPPTSSPIPTETSPNSQYPEVSFKGYSFTYPASLAKAVSPEIVPPPPADAAPWDVAPQYIRFNFDGYTVKSNFDRPFIVAYPVKAFIELNPQVGPIVDKLKKLLVERPVVPDENMPFLPPFNAGQVFHSHTAYINFENGRGVRFLTYFAQDVSPISNNGLFYTFQGLTNDNNFYIAAVMPINHPSLPADSNMGADEYQKLAENYPAYLKNFVAALESQKADTFQPAMGDLDLIFKSFKAE